MGVVPEYLGRGAFVRYQSAPNVHVDLEHAERSAFPIHFYETVAVRWPYDNFDDCSRRDRDRAGLAAAIRIFNC